MLSVETQWMRESLIRSQDRLVHWLVDSALPLWSRNGLDRNQGFAFEYLNADGSPDRQSDRSLAVQAQQIYAFSRAESKGWLHGMQADIEKMTSTASLLGTSVCRSDGFVHTLDKDLKIADASYHVADHALFMMSSAAAWYTYRNGSELRRSYNIFEWLEREYAHPGGGLVDRSASQAYLRLSTQIRLCEAFLYIYRYSGKEKWLTCATDFFSILDSRIYTGSMQSLAELRRTDWSPDPQNSTLNPGDLFSLATLLHQGVAEETNFPSIARDIYLGVLQAAGPGGVAGLVPEKIHAAGGAENVYPCSSLVQLARASLMELVRGNADALPVLLSSIDRLFTVFLDKGVPGSVIDRVDSSMKPLDTRSHAGNLCLLVDLAIDLGEAIDGALH